MLISLNEKAQGLIEYALALVFIAVVIILALSLLGGKVGSLFSKINASFPTTS